MKRVKRNEDERTVLEVAELIKKLAKSKSETVFEELREDDPTRRKPDLSKIEAELGWKPEVELEEGLLKTIEYFRGVV